MERPRPPERNERTGILQITLIGVVLAAVLVGGFQLLARTHSAWERRYGEKPVTRTTQQLPEVLPAPEPDPEYARMRKDLAEGKLRCINGQLFRRLHNGWENIPGESCP